VSTPSPKPVSSPIASYIGSSNMGERSWGRDFELGFVVTLPGNSVKGRDKGKSSDNNTDNSSDIDGSDPNPNASHIEHSLEHALYIECKNMLPNITRNSNDHSSNSDHSDINNTNHTNHSNGHVIDPPIPIQTSPFALEILSKILRSVI